MTITGPFGTRDELRRVLLDQLQTVRSLLKSVEDPTVPIAQLAHLAVWLERLDDRRGELIRALREEATEVRKREEELSVRQFVLRALDELGVPQNAGFIQEYVWAKEGVDLNTRGFGALRRDERRSWHRHPGRRVAYIVPALDIDGSALAQWMARSDWPLEQRIAIHGSGDRLLAVQKLRALLDARERRGTDDLGDPFMLLLEKYAREVLRIEPPDDHSTRRGHWPTELEEMIGVELAALAGTVADAQRAAAMQLAALPEEHQLWGAPRSGRPPGVAAPVRGS